MLEDLTVRLEKYLSVLKNAEAEGNASKIRRYKRIVSQYKDAIAKCKSGKPVPLEELPNPPGFEPLVKTTLDAPESSENFLTPDVSPSMARKGGLRSRDPSPSPLPVELLSPASQETNDKNFDLATPGITPDNTPITILVNDENPEEVNEQKEVDILEELKARLEVYKSILKSAEEDGNASKARRYKRIIKQYTEAIALQMKGKVVPLEELPNPPGFPSLIPTKSEPPSPLPSRSNSFINEPHDQNESLSKGPSTPDFEKSSIENNPSATKSIRITRSEKQTAILRERQKEYRDAALAAKKRGQIDQAKEFLKLCKGFDNLIQASESGLPVDLTTLPVSLKEKKDANEIVEVTSSDVAESDNTEIYDNLEKELVEQIKMCMNTRNHFKQNGDIANANHFEQYALRFKKDLNYIKMSRSRNNPVPKFHYENKTFSAIQSNTDLTDNELELTIMQGINYKVSNPNDVDTYVTYEFPYPSSNPPSGRTATVKNTSNPAYNAKLVFPIHREASACQRVFKRHGIKMEVWSKGGFFHRDSSLGTVLVKLMPLAKEINIHEAFDLMNGRRPAGGKLEVKVRIRDPILHKKVETVSEKWLIIDYA